MTSPGRILEREEDANVLTAVFGIVIGTILVLALIIIIILLSIKLRARRTVKARNYSPDVEKCDAHLMKECKEPCVTNNQGPDIIPEKSFFQERSETTVKTCDSEDDTNLSSVQNDPNTRKYGEYQSVTFTEDPELISNILRKTAADAAEA
ncbi:uncharacterized protein NPIL_459301 [Nephila pilipes]|uniref:Uncharacterized protein n=1 Tax=Nephila pilipes TaxID=299642 RepID=A0A8X6TIZ8_NEPPI|nr:uncharacterized protein NPIL_459301 [Nephila pilipes]